MNHGIPTIEQIVAVSRNGLSKVLRASDMPVVVLPPTPANGATSSSAATRWGGLTVAVGALVGDASATQFQITHNLGRAPQEVRGYVNAAGTLGAQRDLAATPSPTDVNNIVLIGFTVAPAAGQGYYVAVIA